MTYLTLNSVDESKLTDGLGPGFPVPVEITPFCHEHTMRTVAALPSCEGCKPVLRMGSSSSNVPDGDEIAVTDNGNYIVDLHFEEPIKDAVKMAEEIKNTVGVVDHGLFCGLTTAVIIAGSDGISVKEA
jgi:ribose 5-phosphate isomerase A